jgi:flavodoxin
MNTLVVYYSRSGVTRKVAQALATALEAETEELIDTKKRRGTIGFASACIDAVKKHRVPIEPPKHDPGDFDLVVIGSPVWANTMCSAVRTYLTEQGSKINEYALFATTHTSGIPEQQTDIQAMLKKPPVETAGFRQKQVKRDEHLAALNTFIEKLKDVSVEP